MPQVPLIALEILLGFGVPMAWGVWQLISLRREKRLDEARELARRADVTLLEGKSAQETRETKPR